MMVYYRGWSVLPVIAFGLATTLFIAAPSRAQPTSCANATTQFDLNRCAGTGFKIADAKLNHAYTQALARFDAAGKTRLRDAQRAWIVFRDKQCVFESNGASGGSVAPMVATNCATSLTEARTKSLSSAGICVEGDVSCAR